MCYYITIPKTVIGISRTQFSFQYKRSNLMFYFYIFILYFKYKVWNIYIILSVLFCEMEKLFILSGEIGYIIRKSRVLSLSLSLSLSFSVPPFLSD